MNKRISLLILMLRLCSGIFCQDIPDALLWKIEGKKVETSYLFGTIHLLPQKDFVLEQKVKEAIGESEALVMEMDITAPGLQLEMMKYAMMKDGHTIGEFLPDSTQKKLDGMLQSTAGMPLAMVQTMKPFVISSFLIGAYVGSQPASFELSLAQIAQNEEMTIVGLETVQDQLAVFDSIPYQDQADELAQMVWSEEEMKALYNQMVQAYVAEDLNALSALLDQEMGGDMDRYLLENRNKRWIPQIENLVHDKSSFIAVGAGHLAGENGVIELLRRAGYTVTPVLD